MIETLIRYAKRFAVLLPGLALAFFAVRGIYPYVDRGLPTVLAVLLTYIATAYALIPLSIRLIRIVIKPRHIPLYCITPDGFASDPVNIGVVGTERELIHAMTKAGWYLADKRTVRTVLKMAASIVLGNPYPNAPFSNLYLFGRSHDIGFQLPLDDDPSHRHHVRFWAVRKVEDPEHHEHVKFWQKHHVSSATERVLWVGAASLDTGIGLIRHTAQLTHMIHHDTNAERELIVRQLKKTGLVARTRTIKVGTPYQLHNRVWTGYLRADGKMAVSELKPLP